MQGCVTTIHLLTYARTIIREFGWRVYLRAVLRSVLHRRRSTFLECLDVS